MITEKICSKCKCNLPIKEYFYTYNLQSYPDGFLDECKNCISMKININDQNQILNLLQKIDIPFIESEWKRTEDYCKELIGISEKFKLTRTILAKYFSLMRLKGFKDYRFKDTDQFIEIIKDMKYKALQRGERWEAN